MPAAHTAELRTFLDCMDHVEELRVEGTTGYRKLYVGGKMTKDETNPFDTDIDREGVLGKTSKVNQYVQ